MRIAIIGAGVSGLVCARLLSREHEVTVLEAGDSLGGHTRTIRVEHESRPWWVDTGFIVFNERNYPNFTALLGKLGVASIPTSMSFGVRCERTGLEYGGGSLGSLFAQRRNVVRPSFHRMVRDILRFGREAPGDVARYGDATLGEYLRAKGFSGQFVDQYLVPMGAAIWSSAARTVREFPMRFFVEFFRNHGMLLPKDRPQWRVIEGGSHKYVERLAHPLWPRVRLKSPVARVTRDAAGVGVKVEGRAEERFDHVVFASHSDQALRALGDATAREREVLGAMAYGVNRAVTHTDERVLPRRRRAWSSWNYALRADDPGHAVVTYNMAMLQRLAMKRPVCVTLNGEEGIEAARVVDRHVFEHPVYTVKGLAAQTRHGEISGASSRAHGGAGRTHFCGAYWGNGFHEDGVKSALRVCAEFGAGEIR